MTIPDEQAIAHLVMSCGSVLSQTNSYLDRQSLAHSGIVRPFNVFMAQVFRTPGGEEWWADWGPTYEPEFFETMNRIKEQLDSDQVRTVFEPGPWYDPRTEEWK